MATRKRKTIAKPKLTGNSELAAAFMDHCRKKAGYEKTSVVGGQSKLWKYIDFIDPYYNRPCLQFEYLFGARGFLCGRILKWEADEGVGKSSLSYLSFGMGQKTSNALCMLEESEKAPLADDRIAELGCNPDALLINDVTLLDECLEHIKMVSKDVRELDPSGNTPIMVCVDSLRGLSELDSDKEMDKAMQDVGKVRSVGKHAKTLSTWFRNGATEMLKKDNIFLTFIGQLKQKIDTGFKAGFGSGPKKTTIGGKSVNFHATHIVNLTGTRLTKNEKEVGTRIIMKCTKNKIAAGNRVIPINLYKQGGFRLGDTLAEFLANVRDDKGDLICDIKPGAYYSWPALTSKKFRAVDLPDMLYAPENKDLLMSIREKMRIRGFGFDFETKYTVEQAEAAADAEEQSNENAD